MTLLRDLYRKEKRRSTDLRGTRSQQGWVGDRTLLSDNLEPVFRPNAADARRVMESRWGETLFVGDWVDMVFLHFEAEARLLQQVVPFDLDLHEGKAYVSLVAFTMRNMRLRMGGAVTRWLTAPMATHRFLNLRTYVRHRGEAGIFFMKEWVSSRLATQLGPLAYGLPYCFGQHHFDHDGVCPTGRVEAAGAVLEYGGRKGDNYYAPAGTGTLEEFLFERYTAFTAARAHHFFRVWHPPWKVTPLSDIELSEVGLLEGLDEPWWKAAELVSGQQTPGVEGVWMGRPHAA